jgi:class 3 adenylate cyclase/tetratricopeptide (TPR) repeat protein
VTVLFADLKGSMELLADRDPEEARKILDPVLEHMMEAVHRYEGTVNQVMGDGIMALFGAPLAHEDHAVRACYAALRMQSATKHYAEDIRRSYGIEPQIRVGLNSGEVVVRSIGSDLHMDYTAVGQTTHLAARMEQLATPGSTRLTAETLRLAEGYVEVSPLGPVHVKGLGEPVEAYELTGTSAVRSRLHARAAARGLSHFVGRDTEIEQLRRALELARQGRGQIVAVVGEPGVGKSRLVFELTHSHRVEGWLVLEAGSASYGKATPYLPVIDLLKSYGRIGDRDSPRDISEKVTGKLLALDRALEPTLPAFLTLFDVRVDDPRWRTLDPAERRQRTLDGVKRLLLREAQAQPLLVVFEDLHWIDTETRALLDSLAESVPTARVLLLVNYRPEFQHTWGSKTYYTQLRLDTLPAESAGELLDALLGRDSSLEPLKSILTARTAGNPLFIEESVRTLVETKGLLGERGAYHLTQPVETIQVPSTVQAILASRIDRLPPEEKRLLETAAVIGTDVPFALLQAIADESEETLRRGLAHLQTAELLYETNLYPDLEYTFKHALTHEVAYESLLREQRHALHRRIVGAIERLYADRLGEHVERLAQHATRGEVWDKAVTYLRQASAKAFSRSLNRQAVASLEEALAALEHLPESRRRQEQAIDIRTDLRAPLFRLGDLLSISRHVGAALSLAESLGDRRRLGRASATLGHYFWISGEADRALEAVERAVAIAEEIGDAPLRVFANHYLGMCWQTRGDYPRAIAAFTATTARSVEGGSVGDQAFDPLRVLNTRPWLVWAHAERGAFAAAIAEAGEVLRGAKVMAQPFGLVHAYVALGFAHAYRGDVDAVIPMLEEAIGLCETAQTPIAFGLVAMPLGMAYLIAGRAHEAVALLERAVEEEKRREVGHEANHSLRLGLLAEARLLVDGSQAATALATEALERAVAGKERGNEGWSHLRLAEIAANPRALDRETAERHFRHALSIATDLGMRPLVAHCHLGLGKLYRRTGKCEQAQEQFATATTMYRDMDMRFWLEQAGGGIA